MHGFVRRASARVYDSAVVWALVFTAVRTGGNLLVLPLLLHKLSPEDLGLWYVFLSLSGISTLVDLGFSPTMTRVTAFIWAGAQQIQPIGVPDVRGDLGEGTPPNYRLLADLVQTMRLYYRAAGALVTLIMASAGTFWIWHKTQSLPHPYRLLLAWVLFLPAMLINTTSNMWHPLLSGINRVRLNQQILLAGLIANYIAMFSGLLLGAGLVAPVVGYLLMGIISRSTARAQFRRLTDATSYDSTAHASGKLFRTLWPTAWRTGVVTLGIYATVNLNTLICSFVLGLKATASFGLSLQLALAGAGVATTFIGMKIPLIAQFQARGQVRSVLHMIFSRLRLFWLVYITLGLLAIFFGEPILRDLLQSRTPLLPTPILVVLFIVIGLESHHTIFRDIALTAHRNPFAIPVTTAAVLTVILSFLLTRRIGLWGLVIAPGIVQLCFNNWWTVLVGLRSMGSTAQEYLCGLFGFGARRLSS